MTLRRALISILSLVVISISVGCGSGDSPAGKDETSSKDQADTKDFPVSPPNVESQHPAELYKYAGELFQDGKKDDAVFWFYVGQLRYRFHLGANEGKLKPDGDPALFASLNQVVGQPVNEYAFGDIPKLAKTIDKVLAWDAAHDNGFTPKKGNEATLKIVRDGLGKMRDQIVAQQDQIKAQRKANGLE